MTLDVVGAEMECSHSKISRIELGKGVVKSREVRDLLNLYGLTDEARRDELISLARNPKERNWWTGYADTLPASYFAYIDLESAASTVTAFEPLVFFGLLQTEEYARAIITKCVTLDLTDDEVETRISARMERQKHWADSGAFLWVVVDQSVLYRVVGSIEVLRGQLAHLATAINDRTVVQVLPWSAGVPAGVTEPFVVLEFEPEDPPAICIEVMTGNIYVEAPADAARYRRAMDHIRAMALPPKESLALIRRRVQELDDEVGPGVTADPGRSLLPASDNPELR